MSRCHVRRWYHVTRTPVILGPEPPHASSHLVLEEMVQEGGHVRPQMDGRQPDVERG
jgi:hypothetical protein